MVRLIPNSHVQEFYAKSKIHAASATTTTASHTGNITVKSDAGGTADPCPTTRNDSALKTATAAKAQDNEAIENVNTPSKASSKDTSIVEQQQTEAELSVSGVSASNSKPIPRKQFKAIKKKLQKRERRRLEAIEVKKQQTIQ